MKVKTTCGSLSAPLNCGDVLNYWSDHCLSVSLSRWVLLEFLYLVMDRRRGDLSGIIDYRPERERTDQRLLVRLKWTKHLLKRNAKAPSCSNSEQDNEYFYNVVLDDVRGETGCSLWIIFSFRFPFSCFILSFPAPTVCAETTVKRLESSRWSCTQWFLLTGCTGSTGHFDVLAASLLQFSG